MTDSLKFMGVGVAQVAEKVTASLAGGRGTSEGGNALGAAVAGAAATAAAAATTTERYTGLDLETHVGEVDTDALYLCKKVGVHSELEAAFLKGLVAFVWLIQSQCQPGAASATGGEIHPDSGLFLVGEIGLKFLAGAFGQFKHGIPPR